jgi:hypothetical protein
MPRTRSLFTVGPLQGMVVAGLVLAFGIEACTGSVAPTGPTAPVAESPSSGSQRSLVAPSPSVLAVPSAPPAATASPVPTASPVLAVLPSPGSLKLLWQKSGPVTDRTSTVGTAIDPISGNVWVAIPFENRYWIISPAGAYRESWGAGGTGPGQFDFSDHAQNPDGWGPLAFAPDGSFFVGDTGNHRVQHFDKNRHFVAAWGSFGTDDGQFGQIVSLATDGQTVYVGDGSRGDIQAFQPDGTFIRSFGADGGFFQVALDNDGDIHATNPQNSVGADMTLAVFAPDGTERSQIDLSAATGWPVAVTVDAAGVTFVGMELDHFPWTALGMLEVAPSGQVTRMWAGGGDVFTTTPAGDSLYVSRGAQLDNTNWTYLRKYAVPKP